MTQNKGTPKSLREAIKRAINNGESDVEEMYYRVRDFIAQRFQVAMMKNPDCDKHLEQLFKEIIK